MEKSASNFSIRMANQSLLPTRPRESLGVECLSNKRRPSTNFMSDVTLPENLDDWPRDPFALFGVTHTVSQPDLRHKSARLIREYKPERSPEQFRRIREAYETLQQYAAWNEMQTDGAEIQEAPLTPPQLASKPAPGESSPVLGSTR